MIFTEIFFSAFTVGLIAGIFLGQLIPKRTDKRPSEPCWNEFYFRLAKKNILDNASEIE